MERSIGKSIVLLLALVLGLSAMAYGATITHTIVVTPSTEAALGWTHYVTTFSKAPTMYPAAAGFSVAPAGTFDVPGYGHGAFWGNTGNVQMYQAPGVGMEDVGGQVYFGTNNYSGIPLADIRRLYYRSFTADYNTFNSTHYSRTPWRLQLAITKNSSYTNPTRYIDYRGYDGVIDDPVNAGWQLDSPGTCEFPNDGKYAVFNGQNAYDGAGPTFQGAWVNFQLTDGNGKAPWVGDWAHVVSKYSGGKILAGTGYWPGTWGIHDGSGHNPSNTCLTFAIGSPGNEGGSGSVNQDINDNLNLCAWLDYFVIGYNQGSDYIEDTIYFRPDPTPGTVDTTVKNTYDKSILDNPLGWKGNYFVVCGQVASSPTPGYYPSGCGKFTVIDGVYGKELRVRLLGSIGERRLPFSGETVRVKGVLHRFGLETNVPDMFVQWSDFTILSPE
jgi:hypothetical protein